MARPNSNPSRPSDTNAIVSKGVNSPHPLESDFAFGLPFGKSSPGWAPKIRNPENGQFSRSHLSDAVKYLCRE